MKRKTVCLICAFVIFMSAFSGAFSVCANEEAGEKVIAASLKTGDVFEFGYYPQTVVSDRALINQLDSVEAKMISYGYRYFNSDVTVDMSYADITYNCDRYRKVYIGSYRNSGWEENQAQYKHGYYSKCTYYFKWEPIQWTVMQTDGRITAHANVVLDEKVYRDADEAYWENSDMRAWLNGEFYSAAFSEENKAVMLNEEVENKMNSVSHAYGGENTNDRVWLLSYYEMTAENGFKQSLSESGAFVDACDYAYSQGANSGVSDGYSKVEFFLRDVGSTSACVCCDTSILVRPYLFESRAKKYTSCRSVLGVLPVIAISQTAEITNKTLPLPETEDISGGESSGNPEGGEEQGAGENETLPCQHTALLKKVETPGGFSQAGTVTYRCKACGKTLKTESRAKIQSVKLNKKQYVYFSKAVTPKVIIKTSDGKALNAANYSVSLIKRSNNKTVKKIKQSGQYKAVVKFKGEYSGEKTFYFSVKPAKPKITACKKGGQGITIKWKKPKEGCSYSVEIADNKKFKGAKKYSAPSKKGKLTVKGLAKGKKYYIRIRAVKKVTVDGKKAYMYSRYSKL